MPARRLEAVAGGVTAVTGFEKGSGKTTFLSFLLPHAREAGPVAAFTIGVEGGPRERGAEARPEVRVEPGDVVLTSEPMARASGARFEVLETVPGRSALGRLLLGRARRAGAVSLVGSEHFSSLARAVSLVRQEGWARSVLIDGAVSRITQVSALGDLRFAFTVRAHRGNLARVASRLQALATLAALAVDPGPGPGVHRIEGPLTLGVLQGLPPTAERLSVEDFTKVFLEPPDLLRTLERHALTVRRSFELLCFAVALRDLGREEFLAAVGPAVGRHVLFNPYEVP